MICTVPMVVSRSFAILGKAGRYISIANGPNADMTPKVHASLRANAGEGAVFDELRWFIDWQGDFIQLGHVVSGGSSVVGDDLVFPPFHG